MSSIEWRGSNIEIFVKEGLFKMSLSEAIIKDNRAPGQIVWVARVRLPAGPPTFQENLPSQTKKNGFPLDRKLNAIPDLCSPCFTDHSSEEVIPVFVELHKSQRGNTKDQHAIKLEGSKSLHCTLISAPITPN